MQIGGWVNHIVAYMLFGFAFLWSVGTILYWFKARKIEKAATNDKPEVMKIPEDNFFSIGDMLSDAHKCRKCGWGFRVSLLSKLATCPKCGNVDKTRIVKL